MSQFIAPNPDVEVSGDNLLSFVNCMKRGKEDRIAVLNKHGIDPVAGAWYPMQAWLNIQKEYFETVGEMNIYLMGLATVENAQLPPMKNLHEALQMMDIAYHLHHRLNGVPMFNPATGEKTEGIGHCMLSEFDEKNRKATMVSTTPYHSKGDEGVLMGLLRRFKPIDSVFADVKVDITKERRTEGGTSCTYLLSW